MSEPADSPVFDGPIFVLGAMGTGTTLLRLMLDSHPDIAIAPETGFMRAYNAHRHIPFKRTGRGWANRLGWTDEELDAELRDFYGRIFARYAAEHGSRRWGEKTPSHIWHVRSILRLWPNAAFVAIHRHPCGAVASNLRRFKRDIERFSLHHQSYTHELLRVSAKHPRRFSVLRYEDLVLRPEPTMRLLLDRLGEPWAPEVLEHHVVQGERARRPVAEGQTAVADPVDVSRISRWTAQLSAQQRARLEREHGATARLLGYDMDDPVALEPLDEADAPVVSGHAIRRRAQAHPEVDLDTRGRVPRLEQHLVPWKWTVVDRQKAKAFWARPQERPPLHRRIGGALKRRLRG